MTKQEQVERMRESCGWALSPAHADKKPKSAYQIELSKCTTPQAVWNMGRRRGYELGWARNIIKSRNSRGYIWAD